MFIRISIKFLLSLLVFFSVSACSDNNKTVSSKPVNAVETSQQVVLFDVYKNPNCGCCKKWIEHLNNSGFQSNVHNRGDLSNFKSSKGIAPRYRSCHTAISEQGYVFEGHVPAKFIQQFLANPPKNAIGLSVPAMPIGTPGMEMGDRFMPYQVLLLTKDGQSEVYARVNSAKEQF